jgi:hypothetical protein
MFTPRRGQPPRTQIGWFPFRGDLSHSPDFSRKRAFNPLCFCAESNEWLRLPKENGIIAFCKRYRGNRYRTRDMAI